MINQANLELAADAVALVARWAAHPVFKWLCPYRGKASTLDLLAASFARVKGTPEARPAQFDVQVAMALEEGK